MGFKNLLYFMQIVQGPGRGADCRFWSQNAGVQILALPLASLNHLTSRSHDFPTCEMGTVTVQNLEDLRDNWDQV